jgi:hypothetical protein
VDSLTTRQFIDLLKTPGAADAAGYVNLLGNQGIVVPPRNTSAHSAILLTNNELDRILAADTARIRWGLEFLPQSSDALADNDTVTINSWLTIEGVNNLDSLLIW